MLRFKILTQIQLCVLSLNFLSFSTLKDTTGVEQINSNYEYCCICVFLFRCRVDHRMIPIEQCGRSVCVEATIDDTALEGTELERGSGMNSKINIVNDYKTANITIFEDNDDGRLYLVVIWLPWNRVLRYPDCRD